MPASKVVLRRLPRSRLPPLRCDVRLFIVSRYLARAETCVVYERHLKWPDDCVVAPVEACWRAGKTISQAAWPLLDHSGPVKHFAWIFLYRDRPCQEHPQKTDPVLGRFNCLCLSRSTLAAGTFTAVVCIWTELKLQLPHCQSTELLTTGHSRLGCRTYEKAKKQHNSQRNQTL